MPTSRPSGRAWPATLDELRARLGSIEAHLVDVGGLTAEALDQARDTLLER